MGECASIDKLVTYNHLRTLIGEWRPDRGGTDRLGMIQVVEARSILRSAMAEPIVTPNDKAFALVEERRSRPPGVSIPMPASMTYA